MLYNFLVFFSLFAIPFSVIYIIRLLLDTILDSFAIRKLNKELKKLESNIKDWK